LWPANRSAREKYRAPPISWPLCFPQASGPVAIRISVESTAGGFILPNDRVDVIQTLGRSGEAQNETSSRILLTNIRVLAVDQKTDDPKGTGGGGRQDGHPELSPDQAEAIATGQASGALSLALRSASDTQEES
jgi:pilus assembly protein CpaB